MATYRVHAGVGSTIFSVMRRILFLALVLSAARAGVAQQRPNILFIYADDHAAHAVSAYRAHLPYALDLPATPNLDRLAREGMLFRNAFVTNSICGPARAAVLTGQYGHLSGVMTNADSLHPTYTTFPGLLRAGGYQTALIGKWHLWNRPSGFDHYEILRGQGAYYNPIILSAGDSVQPTGYTQDIIADRALRWLDGAQRDTRPFMLMLHFNAPHRFWDPGPTELPLYRDIDLPEPATLFDEGMGRAFKTTDAEMTIAQDLMARDLKLVEPNNLNESQLAEWRRWYGPENAAFAAAGLTGTALVRWKYQRYIKDYMRAVAGIDRNVGRVLVELQRRGLLDNTVIIYSSDQGFFLGDHGWFDKRWMYEESLRTPLLVRWPGVVRAGSVAEQLVMNLDFAQTILDIAGVQPTAGMQGMSFLPILQGRTPAWRDAIYYQYFAYPDWHMVQRQYGVRDRRYKLIHFYEQDKWELFDLESDPHELRSVYGQPPYADVEAELKGKLAALREQYHVPEHDPVPHKPWTAPPEYQRAHTQRSSQ
ncbi:MAG TPA: sulfatase [Longimicrobiales bacterium]